MIVDGHAHACGSYCGANKISDYMEKYNIDKVVLCGGEPDSTKDYVYPMVSKIFTSEKLGYFFNKIICKLSTLYKLSEHIDQQNYFVYEISRELPDKVVNVYWVNPIEENCVEKMQEFYDKYGFKLIKMHQCWTRFYIDCENCHQIFQWAKTYEIPIFIHLLSQEQVELFIHMANRYLDTCFVVAHMIGAEYMSTKLANEHVYFDLSAPQLYSLKILSSALKAYGAKRLLLGSDTPYGKNNIETIICRLNQLNLSNEEIGCITGKNIFELLRL